MLVSIWDELSCEWEQLELEIPLDSSPQKITRAVDEVVAEPLGSIPSEEVWHLKSAS